MTSNEFIYWLKGFIDYQQLQEQRNPAFTRIKDELKCISDFTPNKIEVKASDSIGVINTGDNSNSSTTYKTDYPITYTTVGDWDK